MRDECYCFWNSKIDKVNGYIIIDSGFSKLFNKLNTEGTYRYVKLLLLRLHNFQEEIEEYKIR